MRAQYAYCHIVTEFLVLSLKFSSIQKYHLADVALVIQLALLVVTILKHTTINPGRATNIIELCWNVMFNHYNVCNVYFYSQRSHVENMTLILIYQVSQCASHFVEMPLSSIDAKIFLPGFNLILDDKLSQNFRIEVDPWNISSRHSKILHSCIRFEQLCLKYQTPVCPNLMNKIIWRSIF